MKRKEIFETLLGLPSAPFREEQVQAFIAEVLDAAGVPYFFDPIGNLIAGVTGEDEYRNLVERPSPDPVRIFVAHTDHPGFHGVRFSGENLIDIKWHGGSPVQGVVGSKVWLADDEGDLGYGEFKKVKIAAHGKSIDTGTIKILEASRPIAKSKAKRLYGGFGFRAPVWKEKELYYTKAADDLVGSFAMLALCLERAESRNANSGPFMAIFSRAEEVGFVGLVGHLELGWLSEAMRPILFVSLETSRTLPGAEIGKGPVVRLGDRRTVFHPHGTKILSDLAEKVLKGKHQRRIMDGGTCEATAAIAYGYPAIGISVPLGNYHNQNFQGGPDARVSGGPAPEFVHEKDVMGMILLCQALLDARLDRGSPWQGVLEGFRKDLKRYEKLLSL